MGIYKIKQKDGSYRWVASRYWPAKAGRVRVRCLSRTQAQDVLRRIDAAIKDGSWRQLRAELAGDSAAEGQCTVDGLFERYLKGYCEVRLRAPHIYAYHLGQFASRFGQVLAANIRRSHMHSFVGDLKAAGYKPASINLSVTIIKAAFNYAVEQELLAQSDIRAFPLLKVQRRQFVPLTQEEMDRIVSEAAKETRIGAALIRVLAETGLRRMEGMSLTWDQIDFAAGILTTAKTKNYKPRIIPMSNACIDALRGIVRTVGRPQVFADPDTGKVAFTDRYLKRAAKAAGVPAVSFHDLRRYRASLWLKLGLDVMEVAQLLGHSSIETTRRYLGVSIGLVDRVRAAQIRELQAQNRHNPEEAKQA